MAQKTAPAVRGKASHLPQGKVWNCPTEIIKMYAKKRICSWHKKTPDICQFLLKVILLSVISSILQMESRRWSLQGPSLKKLCMVPTRTAAARGAGWVRTRQQSRASDCRAPAIPTDYNDTHDLLPMGKWSINTVKEIFKLIGISLKDSHQNS